MGWRAFYQQGGREKTYRFTTKTPRHQENQKPLGVLTSPTILEII
jgi:hypothetical protein